MIRWRRLRAEELLLIFLFSAGRAPPGNRRRLFCVCIKGGSEGEYRNDAASALISGEKSFRLSFGNAQRAWHSQETMTKRLQRLVEILRQSYVTINGAIRHCRSFSAGGEAFTE